MSQFEFELWHSYLCSEAIHEVINELYSDIIISSTVSCSRHTTIAGLNPSTTYSIQVAAVKSAGIGVYSDPPVIIETLPSKYTSVFVDVLEKMFSVCSLFSPDLAIIKALV